MTKTAEVALERFQGAYSCSQGVFSACAEKRGVDRDLALRIAAGFGGGMARTAQTCGCVTGAVVAIGLMQSSVTPEENQAAKDKTYEVVRRFLAAFTERCGSITCRDLLGCDISTPEGMRQARETGLFRSRCPRFVETAVNLVDEISG